MGNGCVCTGQVQYSNCFDCQSCLFTSVHILLTICEACLSSAHQYIVSRGHTCCLLLITSRPLKTVSFLLAPYLQGRVEANLWLGQSKGEAHPLQDLHDFQYPLKFLSFGFAVICDGEVVVGLSGGRSQAQCCGVVHIYAQMTVDSGALALIPGLCRPGLGPQQKGSPLCPPMRVTLPSWAESKKVTTSKLV